MKVIYLAGPYRGKTHDYRSYFDIGRNILAAAEVAARLANQGIGYLCPHLNSAHFEVITPGVTPQYWYELDLKLMAACDAIFLLPGWEKSNGAWAEFEAAQASGL